MIDHTFDAIPPMKRIKIHKQPKFKITKFHIFNTAFSRVFTRNEYSPNYLHDNLLLPLRYPASPAVNNKLSPYAI